MNTPQYIPPFVWRLWHPDGTQISPTTSNKPSLYEYEIYSSEVLKGSLLSIESQSIFQDFDVPCWLFPAVSAALHEAETAFYRLEGHAEAVVNSLLESLEVPCVSNTPNAVTMNHQDLYTITKYFSFLRFRNSSTYRSIVEHLMDVADPSTTPSSRPRISRKKSDGPCRRYKRVEPQYRMFLQQLRYQSLLQTFVAFFNADSSEIERMTMYSGIKVPLAETDTHVKRNWEDPWLNVFRRQCWDFCRTAELKSEPTDSFFPIHQNVALYILHGGPKARPTKAAPRACVEITQELPLDVYFRNAMTLSSVPFDAGRIHQSYVAFEDTTQLPDEGYNEYIYSPRIYFSSLSSMLESISHYDFIRHHFQTHNLVDYNRLKQLCRQELDIGVSTKKLPVKGNLKLLDLTDEVKFTSIKFPVAGGTYSDVGQGVWWDSVEKKEKTVAIKYLRQVLFSNAQGKFLQRLQTEILTWHQVAHRNVAPLYGLVQDLRGIGMVSLWYDNGTLCQYIKDRPHVDRLSLIVQIARGLSYLHNFSPSIIHGDLKASNILVDSEGQAVITDFGLSKVKDPPRDFRCTDPTQLTPSFFTGSTRWMAPELFKTDTNSIGMTTASDVYAFANVCLEVVTGRVPYAHHWLDAPVMMEIIRGARPYRGVLSVSGITHTLKEDEFEAIFEACWEYAPGQRPTMKEVLRMMNGLLV
ncbi:hypothetical protein VNI00_003596 [Paramarasmius palmivorus]|uniref:Protein kinase domain-containing protein n=1 Tax=Paramarasmius palmivorus TaxID=297713 RepID=A0AAW0DU81_9AGAR